LNDIGGAGKEGYDNVRGPETAAERLFAVADKKRVTMNERYHRTEYTTSGLKKKYTNTRKPNLEEQEHSKHVGWVTPSQYGQVAAAKTTG